MKKLLCFLLIASLWSCKRQNDIKPIQSTLPTGLSRPLFAADGVYDVLGYGIDATRDPLNPNSVSLSPIIDVTAFATAYASQLPSYLSQNNVAVGGSNFYSGYTALDYSTSLTQTKGFNVGTGNISLEGATNANTTTATTGAKTSSSFFTASFSKNSSDQTTNAYSSRYSYASAEVYQRIRRWAFTGSTTTTMLMNYLTPAFLNDVNTLSADALVARYGTHVLLDISIGGVLKFNYSTIAPSTSITTNKTSDIKIGLGATVFGVAGANIGYNASSAQVTSIKNSSQNTTCTLQYFGGTNSGQTVSIDINGNSSQSINLGSWTASILPTNASVIEIGNALYIYDFIADPAKKAAVMTAVQNHINAAQIAAATDPVYQFYYAGSGGDHYTSGDPNAIAGYSGWRSDGVDFRAFLGQAPGTVPVYYFYSGPGSDHFTTADRNATNGFANWQYYGIQFYAYPTQVPGTIPIYLYWNSSGGDHFTTANPTISSQYPGWVSYGVVFYAFPK